MSAPVQESRRHTQAFSAVGAAQGRAPGIPTARERFAHASFGMTPAEQPRGSGKGRRGAGSSLQAARASCRRFGSCRSAIPRPGSRAAGGSGPARPSRPRLEAAEDYAPSGSATGRTCRSGKSYRREQHRLKAARWHGMDGWQRPGKYYRGPRGPDTGQELCSWRWHWGEQGCVQFQLCIARGS